MATSGTFSFNPALGEIAMQAFRRIGIERTAITSAHMADAAAEANYALVKFANRGPNLWTVESQTFTTAPGVSTYTLLADTVDLLNVIVGSNFTTQVIVPGDMSSDFSPDFSLVETIVTDTATNDREITAFSRGDYAALPNKTLQGRPIAYWYDRVASPTMTLWPAPDSAYVITYWRTRQNQDAVFGGAATADITYLFLDAYMLELAYRLACIYAPQLEAARKAAADEAWATAAQNNVEQVPLTITPMLGGYYR